MVEGVQQGPVLVGTFFMGQAPQKPSLATVPSCKLCIEGHRYPQTG